jgi:putative membrane protein
MKSFRVRKQIWMTGAAVAIWAVACVVALAQGSSGAGSNQQSEPGSANQQAPAGAPSSMSTPDDSYTPNATDPRAFADQSFLRTTFEDNLAQEQMGQLASQKSQSEDVKELGQKMAQIRQQLTTQIMPLAKKLGVSQPKEPSKKEREEIQKMQALSGPDFDAEFLRAMLKNQRTDLKDFQDEERLAKMDEPVLTDHLQILEKIAQSHNVSEQSTK